MSKIGGLMTGIALLGFAGYGVGVGSSDDRAGRASARRADQKDTRATAATVRSRLPRR